MAYNITSIVDNTTGILTFTQGVNNVLMGGWLGNLLLMGLAIIIYSSFMVTSGDTKKSVSGTAFILFVSSLLLKALNLVHDLALWVTLIGCALAIAFTWRE